MKEEPKVKLYPDKTFIAKEIIVDKGKMIVRGEEGGCSYYTSALIIQGDPDDISDDDIKQLRADLSKALESASGK